jgi:hypothetical protein
MQQRPSTASTTNGLNLPEWALKHQPMVVFLLLLLSLAGVLAYTQLGQKEDPEFTVKAMLVQAAWPGSSAQQMSEQVTDKLEKKLQEVAEIDYMTSYAKPGLTQITITLREDTPPSACRRSGTRCARSWATSRTSFRRACVGRSSMTSSATPSATCTPSPALASATRS